MNKPGHMLRRAILTVGTMVLVGGCATSVAANGSELKALGDSTAGGTGSASLASIDSPAMAAARDKFPVFEREQTSADVLPKGMLSSAPGSGSHGHVRRVATHGAVEIYLATDGLSICVLDGRETGSSSYAGGEACNSLGAVTAQPLSVVSSEFGLGYVVVPDGCEFISSKDMTSARITEYEGVTVLDIAESLAIMGELTCKGGSTGDGTTAHINVQG